MQTVNKYDIALKFIIQFSCGKLPHGRFASGDRAPFVLTSSRHDWTMDSKSSLCQRRLLELTRDKPKPRQSHNDSYTTCSADSIVSREVYRDRKCSVCKSTNELLMWGRYSHIDTSSQTLFRSIIIVKGKK
jgi:hypothetical protein